MTYKLQHELSEGNLLLFSDSEFWVFARDERKKKTFASINKSIIKGIKEEGGKKPQKHDSTYFLEGKIAVILPSAPPLK